MFRTIPNVEIRTKMELWKPGGTPRTQKECWRSKTGKQWALIQPNLSVGCWLYIPSPPFQGFLIFICSLWMMSLFHSQKTFNSFLMRRPLVILLSGSQLVFFWAILYFWLGLLLLPSWELCNKRWIPELQYSSRQFFSLPLKSYEFLWVSFVNLMCKSWPHPLKSL